MPAKKNILQYTLNGVLVAEWESIAEVSRAFQADSGNICRCCQGIQYQSAGYMWAYKESPNTIQDLMSKCSATVENLPNEEWRDVAEYKGYYQVSNFGRVKSLFRPNGNGNNTRKEVLLTPKDKGDGYLRVIFSVNEISCKIKNVLVHRLVAEAFIPNPNNLPCVNHKDENKANNSVENLEWCTYSYNVRYSLHKRIRK